MRAPTVHPLIRNLALALGLRSIIWSTKVHDLIHWTAWQSTLEVSRDDAIFLGAIFLAKLLVFLITVGISFMADKRHDLRRRYVEAGLRGEAQRLMTVWAGRTPTDRGAVSHGLDCPLQGSVRSRATTLRWACLSRNRSTARAILSM
jgi:hypothetical protein